MFETKDSGKRVDFVTGAVRDVQEGKPRYDLVGAHGLKRLAELMARGAEKYGERNWEKGQNVSRSYASAFRHLIQYFMGDRDEDHLAAVAFNVFSIIHVEEEAKKGREHFSDLLDNEFYKDAEEFKSVFAPKTYTPTGEDIEKTIAEVGDRLRKANEHILKYGYDGLINYKR